METLVLLFLSGWLGLSVIWQIQSPKLAWLRAWDVAGIMPNWTFFAPNPGTSDFHIVYRYVAADGHLTPWDELALINVRQPINALWNPHKRKTKLLIDCMNGLTLLIQKYRAVGLESKEFSQRLSISVPYLLILNAVMLRYRDELPGNVSHIQFSLVETFGLDTSFEPKIILCSAYHAVAPRQYEPALHPHYA